MNIEIANRLQKLRKEKGLSQEELAEKLGISRQAVSKWERAEASPDTDNLILLARLYGVSLDELLNTEESDEELKSQQKDSSETKEESANGDYVHIGPGGIHVKDKDDQVDIDWHGIHVSSADKNKTIKKKVTYMKEETRLNKILLPILYLLAAVAYILLGTLLDMWHNSWIVFFIPDIVCSFIKCIERRNPKHFNITFLALFAFFFVCMVYPTDLWHPMWVVFLAIPIYYMAIKPFKRKKREYIDINPSSTFEIIDDDDDDDDDDD